MHHLRLSVVVRSMFLFSVLSLVAEPLSQDIDLRGLVTNEEGEGLDGAVVRLVGAELADTADSQGTFTLQRFAT
ncbi:MAG: hypothetical protein GF331_25225, partial [Chitinivibrionales bacterium]|nr:hypothetical protein [Chitinivibrionales bacterium]